MDLDGRPVRACGRFEGLTAIAVLLCASFGSIHVALAQQPGAPQPFRVDKQTSELLVELGATPFTGQFRDRSGK